MIKEVFQTALCELETAFSRKLRAGQWDLWWSHFGELTEEQWVRMIAYAIRTYDTFPSVARMYLARNSVPSSSQSDFDWENKSGEIIKRNTANNKNNLAFILPP